MAKKTKKKTVVKKAVKAAKPAKKSKQAKAKAKARPVKASAKKSSKPAVKKKAVKAPAKASKAVVRKKSPAKGSSKASSKPTVKSKAAKNKKAASKVPVKPVKRSAPAKAAKAVKPKRNASKASAPAKKTVKKAVPAASKSKAAAPKKAASPVKKDAPKPRAANPGPPKAEAKKTAPVVKPSKEKGNKKEKEKEDEPPIEEIIEAASIPELEQVVANGAPVKAKSKRVNGRGRSAQSGPRVITAPITPPKPQVMPADKKKEPKGKFEMEYVVHASAYLLFEFLTTPSGLSEWFADDVNIRQGIYTFFWDGSEQQAKLIGYKEGKMARFQWLDKSDGSYFEFRLEIDDLTGDVSLIITDFAEDPAEMATTKLLWDSQVNKLLHVIGAYY
jgi:uncharacterized protein YndB with AHSA1/START domain